MAAGFKTGGRKPGSPNKVTADVRAIAQQYAPAALKELARLSVDAESEQARVAAIKEILERAYGKSRQALDIDANVKATISRIELVPVGA
jgi:hypothetical protein